MSNGSPADPRQIEMSSYGRRWIRHALDATTTFFGVHRRALVTTLLAPTIGYLGFAYLTAGPTGVSDALVELRWLAFGIGGSAVLFGLVLVIQLICSPAAIENAVAVRARELEDSLRQELAESERRADKLQGQLDGSRLEIDLQHEGPPLVSVDTSEESRLRWSAGAKQRYVGPFREEIDRKKRERPSIYPVIDVSPYREVRDPGEFVNELEAFFTAVDEHWVGHLRRAAIDEQVAGLRVAAVNPGQIGFEAVEVELRLPADLGAGWDEDSEFDDRLPLRPKPWGAQHIGSFIGDFSVTPRADPGRIERLGDELVVTFGPFALPSLGRVPLEPVYLFIPSSRAGTDLVIPWSAASRATRGRKRSELRVPVVAELLDPNVVLVAPDEDE